MKRKKLPPTGKHKGMYVFCSKCMKHFSWTQKKTKTKEGNLTNVEPECGENKKRLSSCKFMHRHQYKARVNVPGTKSKMTRTFDVDNYNDAVIKAIEFENEMLSDFKPTEVNSANRNIINRHYLFDSEVKYLDFLDNVGVPEHQKVIRTDKHIKEVQKSLELFNEALSFAKVKKKMILLNQISDDHVGYFHSYLLNNKGYANKTYNNKIKALRSFFKWTIDNFDLKITNPFDRVRSRSVSIRKDTITKKEFKDLLDIISPENGHTTTGIKNPKVRNRYKPYLKDGIELALHTGGRREEIVELKWNMIQSIEGEPVYIAINNYKVERQLGEGFNDNVVPKIIPITKSLLKLLHRMGYETKKGRDEYLLSPDRTQTSAYAIMDNLSKGFSHFYNQLDTGRELYLKSLRKTYLTYLNSALSGDTKKLSSHSTDDILLKHYIDEKVINKAVKNVDIFG